MKRILTLFIFAACIPSSAAQQPPAVNDRDPEIRQALCQIKNKDYSGAEKIIDGVLQADPQNLYARRLAPGIISYQIKKPDRSPQNIAMIRKAMDAFQAFSKSPGISKEDQKQADYEIVSLAGLINDEMDSTEFLAVGENTELSPLARSHAYVSLAAKSNMCASDLLSQKPRPTRAAVENAKRCVEKGLAFAEKAISLRANSESGWSYRAFLLMNSSKVATLEGDSARAESLKKDSEVALKKSRELFRDAQDEEDKELSKPVPQPDTETLAVAFAKDLITYRSQKPLADLVENVLINHKLTAPDIPEGKPEVNPNLAKRVWKLFSPPGEGITAMLPSNVSPPGSRLYMASSDGVTYTIASVPRLAMQSEDVTNVALNNLTWGTVTSMRNLMLMGDDPATYEVKLLRKDGVGGYPGKTYAVTLSTCIRTDSNVLIVVVTNSRNYAIQVIGAAEDDPRASRFLKSIRFQ